MKTKKITKAKKRQKRKIMKTKKITKAKKQKKPVNAVRLLAVATTVTKAKKPKKLPVVLNCENCQKELSGKQQKWCSEQCKLKYVQRIKTSERKIYKILVEKIKSEIPSIFNTAEQSSDATLSINEFELKYLRDILNPEKYIMMKII